MIKGLKRFGGRADPPVRKKSVRQHKSKCHRACGYSTVNLSTSEAEARRSLFKSSLVYRVNSGPTRAVQGDLVSK